jgi:hypothetical protein
MAMDGSDRDRLQAKFQHMADEGRITNPEHFKKLEGTDGLFEFKRFQIRMPCFFDGRGALVLTHGLTKKKDRYRAEEIDRARRIRDGDAARASREGARRPGRPGER